MSDVDAPYKHTRRSDLNRKPMREMASRHQPTSGESPSEGTDSELNDSSVERSPRGHAATSDRSPASKKKATPVRSPAPKKKGMYPTLSSDHTDGSGPDRSPAPKKKGMYPTLSTDNTDGSGLDNSHDTSHDESFSTITQSGETVNYYLSGKPRDTTETNNNGNTLIILGVIVMVLAVCALLYAPPEKLVPGQPTTAEVFLKNFKEIKNSFPAQDAKFWKIIGTQVKRVLSNDSSYPAVILLGTPDGHASLGTCLTKRVISAVNDAVKMAGVSYIDSASLDQTSAAKAKLSLDDNLKTVFDESKGAIIDHVEKLPAKVALLLHGYCDGDNAPYKDVVLFLLFHTDHTKDDLNDKVVERSLQELWGSELGADEMPALCSRIANNIVVLSPEENESLSAC